MRYLVLLVGLLLPGTEAKEPEPAPAPPTLVCSFLCYPDGRCIIPPVYCVEIPSKKKAE